MIVTICELPDDRAAFEDSWSRLAEHVNKAGGGIDIIAMPRCTRFAGLAQRLERARSVATEIGAYLLSSNRAAPFEGQGWIIAPDGTTPAP